MAVVSVGSATVGVDDGLGDVAWVTDPAMVLCSLGEESISRIPTRPRTINPTPANAAGSSHFERELPSSGTGN
ncbi:MAG: hypothetical protein V9E82_16195, partial [Candidatus Nanopelagicales bacterium]